MMESAAERWGWEEKQVTHRRKKAGRGGEAGTYFWSRRVGERSAFSVRVCVSASSAHLWVHSFGVSGYLIASAQEEG